MGAVIFFAGLVAVFFFGYGFGWAAADWEVV